MKEILARTHVPSTVHEDRSFSAGLHFASLPRWHFARLRNARVNSRAPLVENFDRQLPRSAHRVDGGFILVDSLRRKSIIRKSFLSFSFLGGIAAGRELMVQFSRNDSATFSLGYAALSPAIASGAQDSAAKPTQF